MIWHRPNIRLTLACVISLAVIGFNLTGCGPGWAKLPGEYQTYFMSKHEVFVAPDGFWPVDTTPIIPAKTVSMWWDDRYIVGQCRRLLDGPNGKTPSSLTKYWVVDTKENKGWGPISPEDWEETRTKLGLAENMEFRAPPFTPNGL